MKAGTADLAQEGTEGTEPARSKSEMRMSKSETSTKIETRERSGPQAAGCRPETAWTRAGRFCQFCPRFAKIDSWGETRWFCPPQRNRQRVEQSKGQGVEASETGSPR